MIKTKLLKKSLNKNILKKKTKKTKKIQKGGITHWKGIESGNINEMAFITGHGVLRNKTSNIKSGVNYISCSDVGRGLIVDNELEILLYSFLNDNDFDSKKLFLSNNQGSEPYYSPGILNEEFYTMELRHFMNKFNHTFKRMLRNPKRLISKKSSLLNLKLHVGKTKINDLSFCFTDSDGILDGYIVTKNKDIKGNPVRWIAAKEKIKSNHNLAETINEYRKGTYMFYLCRKKSKNITYPKNFIYTARILSGETHDDCIIDYDYDTNIEMCHHGSCRNQQVLSECLICKKKICPSCYKIFSDFIKTGVISTGYITDSHHLYCSDICSEEGCNKKGLFYDVGNIVVYYFCFEHFLEKKYTNIYKQYNDNELGLSLQSTESEMFLDLLKHMDFLNHSESKDFDVTNILHKIINDLINIHILLYFNLTDILSDIESFKSDFIDLIGDLESLYPRIHNFKTDKLLFDELLEEINNLKMEIKESIFIKETSV